MYRAEPVFNKKLISEWHKESYIKHREKLEHIHLSPNPYKRSQSQTISRGRNKKRQQLIKDENHRIAKDNNILLRKLADIIYNTNSLNNNNVASRLSLNNCNSARNYSPLRQSQASSETTRKRSLNSIKRRRELVKITKDNLNLLNRIQSKKSCYNVIKWEKEEAQRTKFLKYACDYPLLLRNRAQNISSSFNTDLPRIRSIDIQRYISEPNYQGNIFQNKQISASYVGLPIAVKRSLINIKQKQLNSMLP